MENDLSCSPGRWEVQLDRLDKVTKMARANFFDRNLAIFEKGRYDGSPVEWAGEEDADIAAVVSVDEGYVISGATEDAIAMMQAGDLTPLRFVCNRRQPAAYTAAMIRQCRRCVIYIATTGEDDVEGRILPCASPSGFRVVSVSLNEVIVIDEEVE